MPSPHDKMTENSSWISQLEIDFPSWIVDNMRHEQDPFFIPRAGPDVVFYQLSCVLRHGWEVMP